MPKFVTQPENSSLCGQCCVAMAAGVSLKTVIDLLPEHPQGTSTKEVALALRSLGLSCADRLRVVSRTKPVWPPRAILCIQRPKNEQKRRPEQHHWMLAWDGKILDPSGCWPEYYKDWKITSYLEIYS